jgi:hypothetical protein
MIRRGSVILNNVFGKKTHEINNESTNFSEEKKNFVKILEDNEKVKKIIQLMIKDDKNNYCVKIRFCHSVLQYEAIIGSNTELEQKMKKALHDLFLNNKSIFKIDSCHKDLIKMKNEIIDIFLKDQYILNILKESV